MPDKLKIWTPDLSWEEAEKKWDARSHTFKQTHPIKNLGQLPHMPGIAKETAKNLKWKSLVYLLSHDTKRVFLRYFFKHPFQYTVRFLKSTLKKKSYKRKGDFFLYGLSDLAEFQESITDNQKILAVGFSYCHKPFECPSGRFSDACAHEAENPVCSQCFIGKVMHALPPCRKNIYTLFIPTVHYIGEMMFELSHQHADKEIVFLITACEMTLEMFGDWAHMIGAKGVGVRLDGRICNTMKAFELSEKGIKPGLTVVLPETQAQILAWVRSLWDPNNRPDETV